MLNRKVKRGWGFLMFLVAAAAMSGVTMLLWNFLIPAIFGGIMINFWQALGLLVLSRILFGGFGFHHMARHAHGHFHSAHEQFHSGEFRHMHDMSKEERKEFIRRHFCKDKTEATHNGQPEQ